MRLLSRLVLGGIAAALLAGCGSSRGEAFRESVGLIVPPPDPFLVVSRAPLAMPADPRSLPEPRLGAPSRVDPDPQATARAALSGAGGGVAAQTSPGEMALLGVAGAGGADPAIREITRAEADAAAGERRFGLTSFFGIPIPQGTEAERQRLDPREEADRLRDAGVAAPVPPAQP